MDNYIQPDGKLPTTKGVIDVNLNYPGNKYKSKGPSQFFSIGPTSSQPQTNLDYLTKDNNYARSARTTNFYYKKPKGPLNPIKHWRKQLQPKQGHISGKQSLNLVMWNPGTTITLTQDSSCCEDVLDTYLFNGFVDNSNCNCEKDDVIRNELSNYQPVVFNNPARITRPKSSQTILKKNYYSDTRNYLKSRVKLYEQNQLLSKKANNTLTKNNGKPINQRLPPSSTNWVYAENNKELGSQSFNSTYCISDPSSCCTNTCQTTIIFKPNNPFFAKQGAVDSSTRILQAKYKTITNNNYNFNQEDLPAGEGLYVYSVAGDKNSKVIKLPGSTPQKYRGEVYRSQAPYFIKNKYQKINNCTGYFISSHSRARLNGIGNRQPSGGNGNHTTCFYTPPRGTPIFFWI